MSSFLFYLRKARKTPPKELFRLIFLKICNIIREFELRAQDKFKTSFLISYKLSDAQRLGFSLRSIRRFPESKESTLALLCDYYLEHRFDLLGSGWVKIFRGMRCRGLDGYCYKFECPSLPEDDFVNTPNFSESKRIRSLIQKSYQPIDWHLDFKSGYRWDPTTWYRDIPYGHLPGVDIKVPWELSRLQHLPQLALAFDCALNGNVDFKLSEIYAFEFRNQVLDFVAANPPRFGVNWACTMDVAIRVANLILAYDLFLASGATFDNEFNVVVNRAIYEHGVHITQNLEWSKELRGNHYLADIVGLLFVSAYMPSNDETNTWLAFCVQELIEEVGSQFHKDGSNFEASTVYHRLSAEMVIYSTAVVLGLSEEMIERLKRYDYSIWKAKPALKETPIKFYQLNKKNVNAKVCLTPFPSWYFERIEKMAEFTMHTTKPSGHVLQIGDNDSGRFFKISLNYDVMAVQDAIIRYENLQDYNELPKAALYPNENFLDHRHIVAAINGLFRRNDFEMFCKGFEFEASLVSEISGNPQINSYQVNKECAAFADHRNEVEKVELNHIDNAYCLLEKYEYFFSGVSLLEDMRRYCYPDFGLYIFRNNNFFISIRAGTVGQNGFGGHAHNDQLSVELQVKGKDIILDPGTYLYTPLPAMRNEYRSIHAHFAPSIDGNEPASLNNGLFRLSDNIKSECIQVNRSEIICKTYGGQTSIVRHVKVNDESIAICDYSERSLTLTCQKKPVRYSPSYGSVLKFNTPHAEDNFNN